MALINLTPRPIQIGARTILPSGTIATVIFRTVPSMPIEGVPTCVIMRTPQDLPDSVTGTYFIVSEDVARAAECLNRDDLLVAGTTALIHP